MKKIKIFNKFHLGDNVFTIIFLNKYSQENLEFDYYLNESYINELKKHIRNPNINLIPLNNSLPNDAINVWIGYENYYFDKIHKYNCLYDLFYVDFFNMISKKMGIECKIKNKYDLLVDNSNYEVCLNKNYDFLIINSVPLSGQFLYIENHFTELCDFFEKRNIKFITTKKIKNYECTLDHKMSLIDIGKLSDQCRNIIGINTSPIIRTFTNKNIDKIEKRFILDNVLNFSYNEKIYRLNNLSLIYNYL